MLFFPKNVQPESTTSSAALHTTQRTLSPIYFVSKIVGLNAIQYRKGEFLVARKSDWLYIIGYLVVFIALSAYSLVRMVHDQTNFRIVNKTIVLTEAVVVIALMYIVLIFTFLSRRLYANALNLLARIDAIMLGNGFTFDYNRLLRRNCTLLVFMTTSLLARGVLMLMTVRVDFLQQVTLFAASLIKALSKYQFVVLALQLQLRFSTINEVIKTSFRRDKMVSSPTGRLYVLCRLHYKAANVAEILCAAFGVQLLVSIAVSLSDVLFQAYYLYYVLGGRAPMVEAVMVACPVAWLLDETVEVYWLVYACASTSEHVSGGGRR